MSPGQRDRAAIGVRVKSGWAAVVLLAGPAATPRVLDSRKLDLSDPAMPEARQPYHAGFGTARRPGPKLARLITSIERFGQGSVGGLIRDCRARGHRLAGMGVVVGSLIDPARITNPHIRIHALEGRLFRVVVEHAAARSRLPHATWRELELYSHAARILRRPEQTLRATLSALPRPAPRPWGADQKAAALAGWLVLAGRARP